MHHNTEEPSVIFELRLTMNTYRALEEAARKAGRKRIDYILECLMAGLEKDCAHHLKKQ
jgi:uncharacterized protein (DUF1778 family)